MVVTHTDVYWDPYDVEINTDPYPVFKRLREEAPLITTSSTTSRGEPVSRRQRGLRDRDTFISGRGGVSRSSSPAWRCRRAS